MATYPAATASSTDVQNAMNLATAEGDIVTIPASAGTGWTSGVTWTAPAGSSLIGAGTSATGGGDQTVIVDNDSSNEPLFDITVSATGTFRFSGISVKGGTGVVKDEEGVVRFLGPTSTGQIRVDHCTFDSQTYTSPGGTHIPVFANLKGLVDHCIFNIFANAGLYVYRTGASGYGDEVWAASTGFGTDDFIYIEDSVFNGGAAVIDASAFPSRVWDLNEGGKAVLRFNTLYFTSGGVLHATGHNGNGRSGRASETYGNLYAKVANQDATGRTPTSIQDVQGGTGILWGNTTNTDAIQSYLWISTSRRNSATYTQSPTPTGWGYVGPVPLATGTVNVSGTAVTWVSGDHFDTGWPAGTMIYITGMVAEGVAGQEPADGPTGGIASVNSTISITLANGGQTGAPLVAAAYYIGSAWDGNTDAYGYPALDQTGRGVGDLLTGTHPTKVNSTTGTIAWPNQAREPVYVVANIGTPNVTAYSNGSTNLVSADRDYYAQASGIQTNATTPFDGTTGTGWGTLANRPTTCTTGVAYWATDQGSWNQSSSNPYGVQQSGADGVLYVATSTNTWTLYYTPYTYPHPLQASSGSAFTSSMSGTVKLAGTATLV